MKLRRKVLFCWLRQLLMSRHICCSIAKADSKLCDFADVIIDVALAVAFAADSWICQSIWVVSTSVAPFICSIACVYTQVCQFYTTIQVCLTAALNVSGIFTFIRLSDITVKPIFARFIEAAFCIAQTRAVRFWKKSKAWKLVAALFIEAIVTFSMIVPQLSKVSP